MAAGLVRGTDGIWYSARAPEVSYPELGHDQCFGVEEGSFWFAHRNQCIVQAVRAFPPAAGGVVFDVGAGNGFVAQGLMAAGFEVVAVEPGAAGARNARRRGLPHVVCATTTEAGFRPGSWPAAGLFDVVEHVLDDVGFLRDIGHLLQPGGRLYLTVPSYSVLWSHEDVAAGHQRRYSRAALTGVLREAGYEVEFASHIFRLLPIPVFLLRALPYRLGRRPQAPSAASLARDHATGAGWLRAVAAALLAPELRNLERRKPMRFGGSVLLVARKRGVAT
jgi:SAM-dependent methyltransferase